MVEDGQQSDERLAQAPRPPTHPLDARELNALRAELLRSLRAELLPEHCSKRTSSRTSVIELQKVYEDETAAAHDGAQRCRVPLLLSSQVRRIDRVSSKRTVLGGLLTTAAFSVFAISAASLISNFFSNRMVSSSETLWAKARGPLPGPSFPITFTCKAAQGCWYASVYTNESARSAACAAAVAALTPEKGGGTTGHCHYVGAGVVFTVAICSTEDVADGLFVLSSAADASASAVSVHNRVDTPQGLVKSQAALHPGRNLLEPVLTYNHTREVGNGRERDEYFPYFLGSDVVYHTNLTSISTCLANRRDASVSVTQIFLSSKWTLVEVHWKDLLSLWGEIGGMWQLFLEIASFVFLCWFLSKKAVVVKGRPQGSGLDT
ncbi:hypothetical protein AB1Y20_021184 [Prymnesium parvum]|uniref:Transmembrane protein 231 n=1 Tax=Prymnesium parvum TaxID=97485 RepID=A0AB34JIX0_PRYPA